MSLTEILLLAVGLAMDAFSVALCVGAVWRTLDRRGAWRIALYFGLFQCIMPVLGWCLGAQLGGLAGVYDHWVAFGLLFFVGGRMVRSGLSANHECFCKDPTRGATLLMLAIATSVDALAVGFSLGILDAGIILPSLIIGVVTFAFSLAGTRLGERCGRPFGKRVEVLGGLLLIVIGARIVVEHLSV